MMRRHAAVWFNQAWLVDRLEVDQWYIFMVEDAPRFTFSVQNPAFEPWDRKGRFWYSSIYPLTEDSAKASCAIQTVIPRLIGQIPEPLPDQIRRRHKLCAVDFAYSRIHHPSSWEEAEICRYRLAFEELFLLLAGLQLLRNQSRNQNLGCVLTLDPEQTIKFNQIFAGLPFSLTQAQERTWKEVLEDLGSPQPMNRLIQGDVGSGKTVMRPSPCFGALWPVAGRPDGAHRNSCSHTLIPESFVVAGGAIAC